MNTSNIKSEDFIIGIHDFGDLKINAAPEVDRNFYYFYDRKQRRLIKQFILDERVQVNYICRVTLIRKRDKFTPRLALSIRDRHGTILTERAAGPEGVKLRILRANVNLEQCYDKFWQLISFMQSLRDIEVPRSSFSLISQDDAEIVTALRGRGRESIVRIIKQLSSTEGVRLSPQDINELLKRREVLDTFGKAMRTNSHREGWWQDFFERNKWIFGYGLNYQILRQEQPQPYYGGARFDRTGGQQGDYLTSTMGEINFTVLVEIKTAETQLLQGSTEIRSGAWSLAKDLTDALSQIEANIDMWNREGSVQADNRDALEDRGVYTVQPKGIIVVGSLSQLDKRSKWETFQRFRRSIHGIDIITFDELFQRAKYIAEKQN
jgi:hypothetical protein